MNYLLITTYKELDMQLIGTSVGVYKYLTSRCPKSKFPIRINVFDEHTLIVNVIQGLSLSTASLVNCFYQRYMTNGKYYQDSLKGLFCTKSNITNLFKNRDQKFEISHKGVIVQVALIIMFCGLLYFYYFSALKHR